MSHQMLRTVFHSGDDNLHLHLHLPKATSPNLDIVKGGIYFLISKKAPQKHFEKNNSEDTLQ